MNYQYRRQYQYQYQLNLNLLNLFPTASLGATLLVLFFLGIDLYSTLVALGLSVVFAGAISGVGLNDAFSNCISLAITNAVHVGEIISVGRTGEIFVYLIWYMTFGSADYVLSLSNPTLFNVQGSHQLTIRQATCAVF